MRVIRKLSKPVSELEDIFCNKCGVSVKSPLGAYYGLVEAVVTGGYESNSLNDGDVHKFSLCEACLKSLFEEFKFPTLQGNYLFQEVPQAPDFDPSIYLKTDKPAPTLSPEEEQALAEAFDNDKSLIQNMDRTNYDPFESILEGDDDVVELLSPLPMRKKEDLN